MARFGVREGVRLTRPIAVVGALASSFGAHSFAQAQNEPAVTSAPPGTIAPTDRPHTVAELEAGIIALPNAPISPGQSGGQTPLGTIGKGDATIQTGLHLLYRAAPELAFGAGFLFGPAPTSDDEYGGLRGLSRTHSRSYLLLGTEGRYIPLRTKSIEAWVGLTAGGVVIADRFVTNAGDKVPTILGTPEVTLHTEGFALGVQAGVTWLFAERWLAGADARTARWLLPNSPQCSPIGDCTTLTGTVAAFEFGITIGYRIPL